MRRFAAVTLMTVTLMTALFALRPAGREARAQSTPPRPGGPGGARPAEGAPQFAPMPGDSFVGQRDSLEKEVLKQIAGKENMAADSVFKNIKLFKGMPAQRMLRIMNLGWGRSLGVGCFHCHVQDKWDSEDKPQKQIARDMSEMAHAINTEMLPKIKNLKSEKPQINCTTCHRGQRKPALNM